MQKLIQLAYISRATFPLTHRGEALHPEVARILRASRRNNRGRHLVGALYFGDGYFFQCLEGDERDVLALYERLNADPRHTDLRILHSVEIPERSFASWDMKYIPGEDKVQAMLKTFGMSTFNPYRFDEAMTRQMIALLLNNPDIAAETEAPAVAAPAADRPASSCGAWKVAAIMFALLFASTLAWQFIKQA